MDIDRNARVAQFNVVLGTTSDAFLLSTAEAAGRATDPSVAASAAVNAIATAIGLPLTLFDNGLQLGLSSLILTRLRSLHATAAAQSYSWYL